MSIYHKSRVVFIQVPKNASSSIHSILSNRTDDTHDHDTYINLYSRHDSELIESYFSFAVVRNPYDRFLSAYLFRRDAGDDLHQRSFEEVVNEYYLRGNGFWHDEDIVFEPQHEFISIAGKILVDNIIRYENIDEGWFEVATEINERLDSRFSKISLILPQSNVTESKKDVKWESYYTPELKEKVASLYYKDFKMFGYDF